MESSLNGGVNRLPAYPMKVLRVHKGDNIFVRTLSPGYFGFATHYVKKRSHFCLGRECPADRHKWDQSWKGYCSVEQWYDGEDAWFPAALEITEQLELDFRRVFERGQVWEIWKALSNKGEAEPVRGKLHEQRDPLTFPGEYDVVPVIKSLYHVQELPERVKSWIPDRVLVKPSQDAGPDLLKSGTKEQKERKREEANRLFAELREAQRKKKSPRERNQGGTD